MGEKRRFPRYKCKINANFEYYDGDIDPADQEISVPNKGKGTIYDISQGGLFIVSNERVSVGVPIRLMFTTNNKKHRLEGSIVRTGLIKNNPSEIAQRLNKYTTKGEVYIACEFNELLTDLSFDEL